ncbi:cation:proton antiporter [Lysinibacter sp. HNR]|uniref:cation:proton antiporter n=1 Tax=Lysinibacter sp. HNR TaxID=3031408 RepID=UPI0024359418|nr:cation:proton antiporter [Lysinibacter sp. HNR]WGD37997.1 cation:proton antiporter [Lysinibacter sp. HNR]
MFRQAELHVGPDLISVGLIFILAYILGQLGKRIGLPSIPIYMIVGLLASPFFVWFPLDFASENIQLLAVMGLVLLLFSLGLEFDQDEFFGNAGKLLISGGSYILINMGVGLAFGFMVGWGTREALIIAGMTATSSSAIVTKMLIETNRLANRETPMILGVTVVEDIFLAIYLAIVGVVLSGETDVWAVLGKLGIAFAFLVLMFAIARFAGKHVSRLFRTKDDELFTVFFIGLAFAFGGIGEILGVTDAIGAFLIGLVVGATKYHVKVEQITIPLRDIFGAFFFVNFGLTLNPTTFGAVLVPVLVAVLMTLILNLIAGQFVAWLNKLGVREGFNTTVILQNRGEFALILATLSLGAGLDPRIQPFAGMYVLIMAVLGPIMVVYSEQIFRVIFPWERRRRNKKRARERLLAAEIELVDAAGSSDVSAVKKAVESVISANARDESEKVYGHESNTTELAGEGFSSGGQGASPLDGLRPAPSPTGGSSRAKTGGDGDSDNFRPRREREPDY